MKVDNQVSALGRIDDLNPKRPPFAFVFRLGQPFQLLVNESRNGNALAIWQGESEVPRESAQTGDSDHAPAPGADFFDSLLIQESAATCRLLTEYGFNDVIQSKDPDRFAKFVYNNRYRPVTTLHFLQSICNRCAPGDVCYWLGVIFQVLLRHIEQRFQIDRRTDFVSAVFGNQQVATRG